MLGKKILASIFALIILLKLVFVLAAPQQWMGFAAGLLGHQVLATVIYLILIGITGYYIFSTLDLIDIALVMFLTSMLVGLAFIPYATQFISLNKQIVASGMGKAWLAMVIWLALAVATLIRVFSKGRGTADGPRA
ncbi:MAG: hypothetical protein ACLQUW_07050 [Desulfobaccales bacterium]